MDPLEPATIPCRQEVYWSARYLRGGVVYNFSGDMRRPKRPARGRIQDVEAHVVLVQAMADVGADPALVYPFRKTGVYVFEENEKRLSKNSLMACDAAVEEYYVALHEEASSLCCPVNTFPVWNYIDKMTKPQTGWVSRAGTGWASAMDVAT